MILDNETVLRIAFFPSQKHITGSMRTHYCGQLRSNDIEATVTLYGWVDRRRDHGGVIFVDLRDRTGLVQIVSDPERTPASYGVADGLRNEYVVKITGRVSQRLEGSVNPKLPTGEVEVYADTIEVLNAVRKQLPFQVSMGEPETSTVREELRLRYRYLDLRRERMARNLQMRHGIVKAMRRFLEDEANFIRSRDPDFDPLHPRRVRGTIWCRRGSIPASGLPCPSRPSSLSNC
jgi:aspartyl-tRNA synthetase